MKVLFVWLCITLVPLGLWADAPKVPRTLEFAGITLKLNEKARAKIQTEVNALTRYPKYFQIKVDRLQIYFPIIERIFQEEGLPEDFKYLSIQESALISDAVSSSKAVGYWQFKQAAAKEVGLRIDRNVDERKNIVSSTRGAARYLKKNNNLYFDNWVHALLAYHQGPGGAMKLVGNKYKGARSMPINGQTHWYVITFLAHKIAFEQVQPQTPKLFLTEYYEGKEKTIKQIASSRNLDQELVLQYNKWLKRGRVPSDKPYAVILPYQQQQRLLASNHRTPSASTTRKAPAVTNRSTTNYQKYRTQPEKYPVIYGASANATKSQPARINGITGIIVGGGDDLSAISKSTGVTMKRLLYYNDLSTKRALRDGEVLYLKPKKSKAKTHYHIVEPGEDLWSISQRYGIKLSKLRDKNRIAKTQRVKPTRVLWLRFIRPADEPVAYQMPAKEVTPQETESITKEPTSRPLSATKTTVAQDTVIKEKVPAPTTPTRVEVAQNQTNADPPEEPQLEEEEEFELDEPVNFVGVDKAVNVANSAQKVHVVKAGETLYSIAKSHSLTVEELQRLNGLSESTNLSIGQELKLSEIADIPKKPSEALQKAENQFFLYEVKEGETLYQIAREHQATIQQIMEWNQKNDFNIAVGEQLRILERP